MRQPTRRQLLVVFSVSAALVACSPQQESSVQQQPHYVLTKPLQLVRESELTLTGTIKARQEIPVAFQVSGRIAKRAVEPGDNVKAGQVLFSLDPKDLSESLAAASAQASAASASFDTAQADLKRVQALIKGKLVSEQALDQATLRYNEAKANLQAAAAQQQQAAHALQYGDAIAPRDGIVLDVSAEAGQVVVAGQRLAGLGNDQELDVEVQLPESIVPPQTGILVTSTGEPIGLSLRSAAGSADPSSLTRRARYKIVQSATGLSLGRVVLTRFSLPLEQQGVAEVPLGALDNRANGAQVWVLKDGKVNPVKVQVVRIDTETVEVRTDLPIGSKIVALGTHLLQPNMVVAETQP